MRPRALLVDDEQNILKTMIICFESIGFEVRAFTKPLEAAESLGRERYDLAFVDLKMSPLDGMEILAEIRRQSPLTTVVMVTAHGSVDSAVEAIKRGAFHYLQKPFDLKELKLLAQQAWNHHQLSLEVRDLKKQLESIAIPGEIITRNRGMRSVVDLAVRVAESDISVLLEGESGTGKEVLAQLIHSRSNRTGQFVRVNCAALPEQLLESELFGHVKGSFTGAMRDREGRFETAHRGTIFLDEIAEIPLALQAKLLHVLQNREFERVGENTPRSVDVRVVAATNKNLDEALKEGSLREDLYYRLNGVRIKLPPLRERPEDIPPLAQHFLNTFSKNTEAEISPEALGILRSYRWSGNVRELENVMRRAAVLSRGARVLPDHLPEEIRDAIPSSSELPSLEELEIRHIKKVLQSAKDLEEAARILGIDPATLWRKRRKYGL